MGLFNEWEIAVAKKYVRQFKTTNQCLERDFEDDLVDECLSHWLALQRTVKPESEATRKAYMARIVRNKLIDIVRSRTTAKCNDFFQALSLNRFLEQNPESPFLADPQQRDPFEEAHQAELISKIDRVARKLQPLQREFLCAIRDEGLSIQEISVRFKIHRSTVHRKIFEIRQVFETELVTSFLPN